MVGIAELLAATLAFVTSEADNLNQWNLTMLSVHENPHSVNGEMHDKSTGSEIGHNGGPPLEDSAFPSREGFVAIARALRDHWLVGFGQPVTPVDDSRGSYSRAEAWIDLIMECRYREGTINNNGKKMALRKGQLLGAVSWLANRWNWSPKTVRGFLDKLEKEGMITQTAASPDQSAPHTNSGRSKGRYANVLTVCKYELFQLAYRDAGQVPGLVKGKSGAGTGQVEGDIYKEETKEQRNKGTNSQQEAIAPATLAGEDLASLMAADVASWMQGGDEKSARNWLRTTAAAYGHKATRDAWVKLKTDLATGGIVADKLKTMCAIAQRLKEGQQDIPAKPYETAKDQRKAANRRVMDVIANLKVEP